MASVSCVLSEDQLLCAICLEVFRDPVSTSCGHSFCKTCINHHWDHSAQYQCPACKEDFSARPQLKTNTFMLEMVSQFRGLQKELDPEKAVDLAEPGHVPCDVCSEPKLKALKSCLVCLASYCPTHLEPHLRIPRFQRHLLICPVENLEERICREHDRPLELLCEKEKTFICLQCTFSTHKEHTAVPLKDETERLQTELKTLIKKKQQKMQEILDSVKVNNNNADREMAKGVNVFTVLLESVQKSLDQFKKRIREEKKKVADRALELVKELKQEICVLQQRGAEMEHLSEDHYSFIQTFSSVKPTPELKDWTNVTVSPQSYVGLAAEAVHELEKTLLPEIEQVSKAELRRVQQFEVDVTLDPDTAHPNLVLSLDNKQVYFNNVSKNLSDLPQRYSTSSYVLGKQKFSSGMSYFQIQVKGKTEWSLGIAKESVQRKEAVNLTPQNGYFTISLQNGEYKAHGDRTVLLSLKSRPDTVGVFVDYDKGVVSFYNADTAERMYSFTKCSFSENVLPFFAPGNNDDGTNSPLIITPLKRISLTRLNLFSVKSHALRRSKHFRVKSVKFSSGTFT